MSKIEVQEDTNCWAVVPAESHGVVAVACSEEAATAYLVSHFADVSELSHEEAKKRVDAGDHDYIVTRCAVRVVFWNDCEKIGDAVERHHLDLRDYSGEAALRAELARVTAARDALLSLLNHVAPLVAAAAAHNAAHERELKRLPAEASEEYLDTVWQLTFEARAYCASATTCVPATLRCVPPTDGGAK